MARSTQRSAACCGASPSPWVVTPDDDDDEVGELEALGVDLDEVGGGEGVEGRCWRWRRPRRPTGRRPAGEQAASSTSRGATAPLSETSTPASAAASVTAASRAAAGGLVGGHPVLGHRGRRDDGRAGRRSVAAVDSDTAASDPGSTTSATRRSWSTPASTIGLVSAM